MLCITVIDEKNNRLTSWCVYSTSSTNLEKLVIPRVGESIGIEKESYTVFDVEYVIPYKDLSVSPDNVYIRVKKKEENEQPKYE